MKKQLKVIELFAGIGSPRKALIRGGYNFKIVDAIEIDKYAVKSYNAIYNENIEAKDICSYNPTKEEIGEIDLLFHGSPCQDFSLAGKQAGGDKDSGTRSSLMYETIRIVEELKPKYVIWENVKNLLSKKHRHNFDAYLETMEHLGYTNYYQVLNAKDYGIPQNRERVFTVSILNNGVVGAAIRGRYNNGKIEQHLEISDREYANAITTVQKDCLVCEKNKQFTFPPKQELKLKLKDMLEDEIDEKYYLSDKMIKYISTTGTANFKNPDCKINLDIARPLTTDQNKRAGTTNYLSDDLPNNYDLNGSAYLRNFEDKGKLQNKECCDTLTVSMGTGGGNVSTIKDYGLYGNKQAGSVYNKNGLCPTITTEASQNWNILLNDNPRIRKLTPKECWRLMGFDDEDFEKASQVNSATQLYKQAGNSIVVNVIEAIYDNLLIDYK